MRLLHEKVRASRLFATTAAVLATAFALVACGGGGGTPPLTPTPTPTPTSTPLPQATLSSVVPASGATGVTRDVTPVITLAVTNATSSDGSKLSLLCTSRAITFSAASVLSTDAKSMTVTLTPQADAILAGDTCTLTGDISTTGAGGTTKTAISTSFSIYAAPIAVAKGLSLIAGTADNPGSKDGQLLDASFHAPFAMTKDAQGNIYVADGCTFYYDSHALIRKISTTGVVTTVAGSVSYGGPWRNGLPLNYRCVTGITAHPDGNLYTIDSATRLVQRITPQGQVTTITGAYAQSGTVDGVGAAARFTAHGITADPQGNLFLADTGNHTIRKIDSSGNVTTYAGQAGVIGDANGDLQSARFKYPTVLKFDSNSGKLFVGDQVGVRVISNGSVSTTITTQQLMNDLCPFCLMSPDGLDISSDGRIAVTYANARTGIYKDNNLAVVVGGDRGDADGPPSASKFYFPSGVAFLPNGDLLVSDIGNHNIKRYSASANLVNLYAGKRHYMEPVDGVGSAAKLDNPFCMVHSPNGDIWFSQNESVVRKVNAAGIVSTILTITNEVGACVIKVNDDGSFITAARYKKELRWRQL